MKPDESGGKARPVPLDAAPSPRGTVWFVGKFVVFARKDRRPPRGVRLFRPHFIDCEGYKAKKRMERLLKNEPECSCSVDECLPDCGACAALELGVPCRALGVPGS